MQYSLGGKAPLLGERVFIAPSADLIGDVQLGDDSSIWYNVTLRADLAPIQIGARSNIQDNSMIHVDRELPAVIGNDVTVGHGAILHACTIEDHCLIGMGAIVLDGAQIGAGSIIGAGAVVPPGMVVPPRSQVMGVPGRVVKQLDTEREQGLIAHAKSYVDMKEWYQD